MMKNLAIFGSMSPAPESHRMEKLKNKYSKGEIRNSTYKSGDQKLKMNQV
jgi:hypothetical protein